MIRTLIAVAVLGCAALSASAQQGATPATEAQSTVSAPDRDDRVRAFVTLIAAACTPQLVEEARKGKKACALIWYALDPNQNQKQLPGMLAKMGYRPVVDFVPSPDGDPLKASIKVAHPQSGEVSTQRVTALASAMTIAYRVEKSATLYFRYTVIGVVFPALCKTYPDKCGMKTYKDRVFDLREYKEDTFNATATPSSIAPPLSTGLPQGPPPE